MSLINFDTRLICRSYDEPIGWSSLLSNLRDRGWVPEGNKAVKNGFEIEVLSVSEDGLEVFLALRSKDRYLNSRVFREIVEQLINRFWYIDIYYSFRDVDLEKIARMFSLGTGRNEIRRIKIGGVEVVLEFYPFFKKLTASYRVSLRELDAVGRIHSKLLECLSPGR